MESKELCKQQTFVERLVKPFLPSTIFMVGMVSGLISTLVSPADNIMIGMAIIVVAIVTTVAMVRHNDVVKDDRDTTVNLFVGDHEYNKFVELSLKYLGYETNILVENGKQQRDFIVLNDKHLVCVPKNKFSLGDIDKACRIAKENDKSLTVIIAHGITSVASMVAKQNGIIIHDRNDLDNTLYKTIKTKGGEPIRECLCT